MSEVWFEGLLETLMDPWVVLGFAAQSLFFFRWIIQWYVSEKNGISIVPLSFWIISLIGGLLLLVYAIREGQPVFAIGQLVGVCNYCRNIVLMTRYQAKKLNSAEFT